VGGFERRVRRGRDETAVSRARSRRGGLEGLQEAGQTVVYWQQTPSVRLGEEGLVLRSAGSRPLVIRSRTPPSRCGPVRPATPGETACAKA